MLLFYKTEVSSRLTLNVSFHQYFPAAGPERGGHTQVVQGRPHPQGLDRLHGADEEVH